MNKKLFELDEGTPDGSMKFAYGKAGEAAKNITLDNLKDLIVPAALKTMVKEIGFWDMNTKPTFPTIIDPQIYLYSGSTGFFPDPLPVAKIRKITVTIISDDGNIITDLLADQTGTAVAGVLAINVVYHPVGGFVIIPNTTVTLTRRNGGIFDNSNYDSTTINRGWVTIEYVE
jgi:hypothetical protein